jgi:hypothetical protein
MDLETPDNIGTDNLTKITRIRYLVGKFPKSIPYVAAPDSSYKFTMFAPDQEWTANEGLDVAFNRELEILFGTRVYGRITFREQGPELSAIADVLEEYTKKLPACFYLDKWISDILTSAEGVFNDAGIEVRCLSQVLE